MANDGAVVFDDTFGLRDNFFPVGALRTRARDFENSLLRRVFIGGEIDGAIKDFAIVKKVLVAGDGYEFAVGVGQVFQRHLQRAAPAVDFHRAVELPAFGRRHVVASVRRFLERKLRAEGVVERVRAEAAGVDRSCDELPERVEVLELRLRRIVIVRGTVVDVGGDPYDVSDFAFLEKSLPSSYDDEKIQSGRR